MIERRKPDSGGRRLNKGRRIEDGTDMKRSYILPHYAVTPAPAVPTALTASAVSSSQINLTWLASAGPSLKDYGVYRQGAGLLGFVTALSFADTGLTPSTSYTYFVTARNLALVESGPSNFASATTQSSGAFTPNANFSIAGSFAEGGVLTITDAAGRLGNKPNGAKPILFFDYAGGTLTPNAAYSRNSTGYAFSAGNVVSSANLPPNGLQACACDMTISTHVSGPQVTWNQVSNTSFYRNVSKYYTWSPGVATNYNTNLKSLRVWQTGQIGNNLWVNENCDNLGHGTPGGGLEANAIDPTLFNSIPLPVAGVWYVTEVEVKQSSAQGVTDGYMKYVRDAVYMLDPAKRWTTIPNSFPSPWIQHVLDQISNNVEPAGATAVTTWDYCDDSLARVLWSAEPSYQNAYPSGTNYTRTPLIPSSWTTAAGVSTVTAFNRLGPNASLAGLYLYVLDTNGVAYQIGRHT